MKLIRRLLAVVLVLVLLIVGAVFLFLEPAVVAVVEKGGTHALGVETKLADARMGVLSGEFGLSGLTVDNPPGFEAQYFLDMRETGVDVEMGSLMSDRVVIPRVLVSGVTLVLERNANGTNYDVLLRHLESLSGPEDETPAEGEDQPSEEKAGKKLVIGELVLRDIRSEVSLFVIGEERRTIPINLPEITIRNLGGEEGADVDVVYSQLIEELLKAVVAAGGDQLPADLLSDLDGQLKQLGREHLEEQTEKVREKVEESIGEEGLKKLEDASESVKDLFGKGKD